LRDSARVKYPVLRRVTEVGEMDFLEGGAAFPWVALRTAWGRWQLGAVRPRRAGLRPVRMLARVGEQRGLAE
jgi:hypothetical protein